jgi:hypothetical protein
MGSSAAASKLGPTYGCRGILALVVVVDLPSFCETCCGGGCAGGGGGRFVGTGPVVGAAL